jgi:hypothetical protein
LTAQYHAFYEDENGMIARIELEAGTDAEALRVARGTASERAQRAREAYRAKGIRLRIRSGLYQVQLITAADGGRIVFPKN